MKVYTPLSAGNSHFNHNRPTVRPHELYGQIRYNNMKKNKVTGELLYKDERYRIQGCVFEALNQAIETPEYKLNN
jgi:hypothetical protein